VVAVQRRGTNVDTNLRQDGEPNDKAMEVRLPSIALREDTMVDRQRRGLLT